MEIKGVLIDENFSLIAKKIVLTRNLLVHPYRKFSLEDLNSIIKDMLPAAEKLVSKLLEILESKNIDPQISATELSDVFKKHNVSFAYIFGSRARGTAREDSDYDIAVFFRSNEVSILDETSLALDIAEALGISPDRIDVVALNRANSILIARVFKEGRILFSDDEELRRKWERETYLKILGENDLTYTYVYRVFKKKIRGNENSKKTDT